MKSPRLQYTCTPQQDSIQLTMNFQLKRKLIQEAQNLLVNAPQDLLHEITHHYRTWMLAQEIGESIHSQFNRDVLEVICWWHDVKIPDAKIPENKRVVHVTADHLVRKLPREYTDCVKDSIINHEYGSTPKYIEGRILQDADKLDLLSTERVRIGIEAVRNNRYPRSKAREVFVMITKQWIPNFPKTLHFTRSKNLSKQLQKESREMYAEFAKVLEL